ANFDSVGLIFARSVIFEFRFFKKSIYEKYLNKGEDGRCPVLFWYT
ncbi:hypothetical protein X975_19162, partial [Stegodyphus mimosarum]